MSTAKQFVARVGDGDKKVERQLQIEPLEDGRFRVVVGDTERIIEARRADGSAWVLLYEGRVLRVDIEAGKDGDPVVELDSVQVPVKLLDPRRLRLEQAQAVAQKARGPAGPEVVRTPMPGKVVKLLVKVGDAVAAGQGVCVVEAMKMENELRAARGGKVAQIHASEGQTLEAQAALVTIE